nr:caspase family protein [Pseudomonadota bacterium]
GAAVAAAARADGPRIALVIGIGNYGTLGNLSNPANDARGLAEALRAIGFEVDLVVDADQRRMKDAISRLGERMARAGPGSTGLFYFAGHGVQSRGVNYLVPARAAIRREADLELEAVAADTVLLQMQEAGVSTNIVILDACRNMPLTRNFRSGGQGLAQMDAPNGSFIAYSTAPGSVAADGGGTNSPFASALLREIVQPGQPIEAVFRNVRRSVLQETEGQQTPWDSSSLIEPFFFRAP